MTQIDHPSRLTLVNELHARPSPRIVAPASVAYVAFKEPQDAVNRDRARDLAHLAALALRSGAPAPQAGVGHYAAMLGRSELRWESHAEFVTFAAFTPGLPERAFDPAEAAVFPESWQETAPGRRLAAVLMQIDILPENPAAILPMIDRYFAADGLTMTWVLDEQAVVATDFRIDPAGWMRMAVFIKPGNGPGRTGRLVQRLLELETYRAMSMLGLGRARDLSGLLNTLDPRLVALVEGMVHDPRPAAQVLDELLEISARLESAAMQMSFRFGATEAYGAIVEDRINALRETRFEGRQMLREFMARRYQPAMRTVKSAQARLAAMTERVARAGDLLRTRVDVERSGQNQSLLSRMDRRAALQLRLQHTVEGLSVVAISYYAVGLLGYALYPVAHELGIDKGILVAALVPVVIGVVWLAMRRIKTVLHREAGHHGDDL